MIKDDSFGSSDEWELLFALAQELTGNAYTDKQKSGLLSSNVARRARQIGINTLAAYIERLADDSAEIPYLLTAVTIHTTSWFRELPHFQEMENDILKHLQNKTQSITFNILFAACSTGQEVYSFAVKLEKFRSMYKNFDYRIEAFDIDPICVDIGKSAIYPLESAPKELIHDYANSIRIGKASASGFFTFSKELRQRISWSVASLLDTNFTSEKFDWIVCRNVLIYFDAAAIKKIAFKFKTHLKNNNSRICLGHSESFETEGLGLKHIGRSIYSLATKEQPVKSPLISADSKAILIVDDSNVVRERLKKIFEVTNSNIYLAANANEATTIIKSKKIDFITLDLQMPDLDGISWAKNIRELGYKTPIVLISDSTLTDAPQILDALGKVVQEYFEKKNLFSNSDLLIDKLNAFTSKESVYLDLEIEKEIKKQINRTAHTIAKPDVILIGASTGGTTALTELLRNFPKPTPPIVIVQHITPHFAKPFAERLAAESGLTLGSSQTGTTLEANHLYLSWGDYHIGINKEVGVLKLTNSSAAPVTRHRPSVDFLFESAALLKHINITAVLLTGMGADGARGLLKLKQNGHWTICQDKNSCVVFGMPKEAIYLGAASKIGSIQEIRNEICSLLFSMAQTNISSKAN
jgi:two-component system chemotaxis response regulator CheB